MSAQVALPLALGGAAAGVRCARPPASGRRALLVEDDPLTRKVVSRLLRRCAFDVHEVVDGRQALEALARDDFDLVLSDQNMPQMTGLELLSRLDNVFRGRRRPLFVMMSSQLDVAKVRRSRLLGAKRFLPKPISVADLQTVLRDTEGGKGEACAAAPATLFCGEANVDDAAVAVAAQALGKEGVAMVNIKRVHSSEDVLLQLPLTVSQLAPVSAIDGAAPGTSLGGSFSAFRQTPAAEAVAAEERRQQQLKQQHQRRRQQQVEAVLQRVVQQQRQQQEVEALQSLLMQQRQQQEVEAQRRLLMQQRKKQEVEAQQRLLMQQRQQAQAMQQRQQAQAHLVAPPAPAIEAAQAPPIHSRISCNPVPAKERRAAALEKYRLKRKNRCWDKKVRYESRQRVAVNRLRVTGRFAKKSEIAAAQLLMADTEALSPAPALAEGTSSEAE